MTKKQKLRRNSFTADFNDREDDLILADLDVMLEDEPSPVPLNHFFDDEETIDRLLVNAGFDANSELKEDHDTKSRRVIDDISRTDGCDIHFEERNAMVADAGIFDKEKNDYENKAKKAAIITYTSLSFAGIALLSTVVMGVIVSSMQTKISKLTELVSILEEDMSNIAGKNSDFEINNSDLSAEQQSKTPVLENKKSSTVPFNKVLAEKKVNTTQATTSWSVNLNAYEEQRYANSKAEKFMQKGIPVKVIAVNMNNATWYRLKVGGFKNLEEATSYAAKIKKSLNLNTVFVGKN